MQLRAVKVTEKGANVQFAASLEQWLRVFNISMEAFKEDFEADLFQLTKYVNAWIRRGENEEDNSSVDGS